MRGKFEFRPRSLSSQASPPLNDLGLLGWTAVAVVAAVLLAVGWVVYMSVVLAWSDRRTDGLGYYGASPRERDRFRRSLRAHARLLRPLMRLLARVSPVRMESVGFRVRGVSGPRGTCSEESFEAGMDYEARPEDVFVVTQMKCGTTWMQHVVYEVLMRGRGHLVESGTALYAISPWLEARKGVPVEDAPAVGAGPRKRIIKTHLPAEACPDAPGARYVYVCRHPGSCFASCVDFLRENMGPFTPPLEEIEGWFRSQEHMWWGTWPDHVSGWWRRRREKGNVLWVRFEDMKADLPEVVRRVADFLEVDGLTGEEVESVVRKCGFDYMRDNQEVFEMHPPHLLAAEAELFVRGSADRFRDVPREVNERIVAWCEERAAGGGFAFRESYPTPSPR